MTTRRSERGQSLLLAAIMVTVLVGFTGLAVDGGEASVQQQAVRNAADGAALAAGYDILVGATTEAAATTFAQDVVAADGLATSDLTMSYLDSGGAATAVTANVVTVQAVVADTRATFFLGAVGIPTVKLTATAQSSAGAGGSGGGSAAACGLCTMVTSGAGITTSVGADITVTGGGTVTDSTSNGEITLGNNSALIAPSNVIGGGTPTLGAGATITPSAVVGATQSDPFPALAYPSLAGAATAYTAPGGSASISAGIYSSITVNAGSALTLNSGVYVLTGALTVNGGSLTGSGVTIFMGCAAYPTACGVGAAGGHIVVTSGSLSLTPTTAGAYTGMTIFADRNNKAASTDNGGTTFNVLGTWYGIAMPISDAHTSDALAFGQLIVASVNFHNNDVITVSRSGTIYGALSGVKLSQ